ncbi:MAG: BrnT family toxin [Terriglobales bacterium]
MTDWRAALANAVGFDRDAGNAEKIRGRHAVTPTEADQALLRRPLLLSPDDAHSGAERRYFALGETAAGRRLALVFTLRHGRVRVISARPMSRRERGVYAQAAQEEVEGDSEV